MKRNDYSSYNRGQEISGVTFQQHQNQVIEGLNTIMLSLGMEPGEKTVLWGLQNSGTEDSYDISEGAIFTQGEIFLVDAFSATDALNVPVLNPVILEVGDPVRFADGSIEAVHKDHKYQISMAAEDSGEVNYSDLKQLKDVLSVMLDVDSKLSAFMSDLVGGASEGFNTFAEVQAALGSDPDFATNISDQVSGKASQVSHDVLAARVTTNEASLSNIEDHRGIGGTSLGAGVVLLDRISSYSYVILNNNQTHAFSSAKVPAEELVVKSGGKRVIKAFCDFYCSRNAGGDENINLYIVYRIGSGSWTSLRGKELRLESGVLFSTLRAHLELSSTPTDDVEFGLKLVHPGGGSMNIAPLTQIEFDTIY